MPMHNSVSISCGNGEGDWPRVSTASYAMARQEKAPRNKDGELAAIKAGGWKIRRSDLEQL